MALYAVDHKTPQVAPDAWITDSAQVIGDVTLGAKASVWFGAIARANNEPLTNGAGSYVREAAVLHSEPG